MHSVIGLELLERLVGMALMAPIGAFAEVGVYQGGSALKLYEVCQHQGRQLFLYDTFSGMPVSSPIDHHPIGDFADCSYEQVCAAMPAAHVIKGVFPDSVVPMPRMAFVHADADQYESTLAICRIFEPMMNPGGLMVFDDYRGLAGCIKAVDEYFPRRFLIPDGRVVVKF